MTSTATPDPTTTPGRRRRVGVVTLLVVGCFLAATAAIAVWARTTALDTDSYVATVSDLPRDPAVSAAFAQNVVDIVLGDGIIEQKLGELLPENIAFLSAPIASSIRDVAVEAADEFVASDGFQNAWETVNRAAHPKAVDVLTGRSVIAVADDGKVTVDVTEIAAAVRMRLEEAGLGNLLPPPRDEAKDLVLFEVGDHGLAELTVDLLDLTYWLLPILAILALGFAIWLSDDRRRTSMQAGIGIAMAVAASLVALSVARAAILGEVLDPVNHAAIAALWDRLFDGLTNRLLTLLFLALVGAGAAFLVGPHPWAESTRGSLRKLRSPKELSNDGA